MTLISQEINPYWKFSRWSVPFVKFVYNLSHYIIRNDFPTFLIRI